jgi:anti-anti-sigma factor
MLESVEDIGITRQGTIVTVSLTGEWDMANVDGLDAALRDALVGEASSCLLDLSAVTFMDSSVVNTLIRWSKEAQVSEREALAIVVGGQNTPATRILTIVDLLRRLPVFTTVATGTEALKLGQKPRPERPLRWLTDAELATERDEAQTDSDAANRRLDNAIAEQAERHRENSEDAADA